MKFDTSSLRRTSDADDVFPWRARDVPFILVTVSGLVRQAQGINDKRAMLEEAKEEDCLLAAWPGQWRQDIFVIDDRGAAIRGLGAPGR
jgi:hypothetical protein